MVIEKQHGHISGLDVPMAFEIVGIQTAIQAGLVSGADVGFRPGWTRVLLYFGVVRERNTEKAERMHSIDRVPRNRQYRYCGGKRRCYKLMCQVLGSRQYVIL